MRADKYFAEKFGSRTKAAEAIEQGLVLVNGKPIKSKAEIQETDEITFVQPKERFVSNGGYKLAKAVEAFSLSFMDKTYVDIYQSVPFTQNMKKQLLSSLKLIINIKHVAVILDKNENIVCFGICFPAIGKQLQKSGGRLTPLTLLKLLKTIKYPTVIDLGLIGVVNEYRGRGIATALICQIMNMLSDKNIEYAETNLNLEDNANIINQWKSFDSLQHKRRRSYVKKI